MQSMSMRAVGKEGQIRVGGRVAAELGDWTLTTSSTEEGRWALSAAPKSGGGVDNMLLDSGAPIELRLTVASHTWRWKNVTLGGRDPITIYGSGHPEII